MPAEKIVDDTSRIPANRGKVLKPARLALISAVKQQPDSITAIALRLHRDRSAVKCDVDRLHKAGLFALEQAVVAGLGMMKRLSLTAKKLQLHAALV